MNKKDDSSMSDKIEASKSETAISKVLKFFSEK